VHFFGDFMSEIILAKIAISKPADEALNQSIDKINEGFDGGRVTKTDLASWFILQFGNALDSTRIEEIRRAHFNQVVYLESLVKKLKSSGRENLGPEELSALQAMLGQETMKKRSRLKKEPDSGISEAA
jgi:hypothetical protein